MFPQLLDELLLAADNVAAMHLVLQQKPVVSGRYSAGVYETQVKQLDPSMRCASILLMICRLSPERLRPTHVILCSEEHA